MKEQITWPSLFATATPVHLHLPGSQNLYLRRQTERKREIQAEKARVLSHSPVLLEILAEMLSDAIQCDMHPIVHATAKDVHLGLSAAAALGAILRISPLLFRPLLVVQTN